MDFASSSVSGGNEEFRVSLRHVRRVMRVFSPELVRTVEECLSGRCLSPDLMDFVGKHERNLGASCPPHAATYRDRAGPSPSPSEAAREPPSLSSLRGDAHSLLEEMHLGHGKRLGDMTLPERVVSRIEGLGSHGVRADGRDLDDLTGRVAEALGFPAGYRVLPGEDGTIDAARYDGDGGRGRDGRQPYDDAGPYAGPEREGRGADGNLYGGILTDRGREQLLGGYRRCSPHDVVAYVGDPMFSRVRSYEVEGLVTLTLWASERLNIGLGLVPAPPEDGGGEGKAKAEDADVDGPRSLLDNLRREEECRKVWFRINLRFLADRRNLLFLALTFVLSRPFR